MEIKLLLTLSLIIPISSLIVLPLVPARYRVKFNFLFVMIIALVCSSMTDIALSFVENKKYKEISVGEIFPVVRKHSSYYTDFFSIVFINRIVDRLNSMNYFRFIQNGQTQRYIFYGLFCKIIVSPCTLLNFI